mgnify:CR=1
MKQNRKPSLTEQIKKLTKTKNKVVAFDSPLKLSTRYCGIPLEIHSLVLDAGGRLFASTNTGKLNIENTITEEEDWNLIVKYVGNISK